MEDDPAFNCFRLPGEGPLPSAVVYDESPPQLKDLDYSAAH